MMSILKVVQPEEFDPSNIALINDKLSIAISKKSNNILHLKNDGLFAAISSGVLGRYIYRFDSTGTLVHENVEFKLTLTGDSTTVKIYGTTPSTEFGPTDLQYSANSTQQVELDGDKYFLSLNMGSAHSHRSIIKFQHNGMTSIWAIHITRPFDDTTADMSRIVIVIDEMTNGLESTT